MSAVVGTRVERKEDPPLLTGEARFVADLAVPGALHLALVRSPHAHARITSIDTAAAAAMPGVVAVFTGADLIDQPLLGPHAAQQLHHAMLAHNFAAHDLVACYPPSDPHS